MMIRNIVGRLHVSASSRDVIREIRNSLKKKARRNSKLRQARKEAYREGLEIHKENVALYNCVMSGRF